ncbi:hypothetical protein B7494_g2764 [Chlorociboria aeruginascens]|nr:hypothetical protein B7494_g2764 [Chlorociboria aeruginascens]
MGSIADVQCKIKTQESSFDYPLASIVLDFWDLSHCSSDMSTACDLPTGSNMPPTEKLYAAPNIELLDAPQVSMSPVAHDSGTASQLNVIPPVASQSEQNRPEVEKNSTFGEDDTTTTSLSDSDYDYQYENGRRYHAFQAGQYLQPNDNMEQERLDLLHHICQMIKNDALHLSPLQNPQRILDIGTGTGIWAIDIADQYPSAEVIGLDLRPSQPLPLAIIIGKILK